MDAPVRHGGLPPTPHARLDAARRGEGLFFPVDPCTVEHGAGLHEKAFLPKETGAPADALMKRIRAALEPHGILNPDKIF